MKRIMLKICLILIQIAVMGMGCRKVENPNTTDYVLISDVFAQVYNNDSQAVPYDKLIWSFEVDEISMLKIQPYRGNYLIPKNLPDEFKTKGIKIKISGKIFLNEFSSIYQSDPYIKLSPSYKFEITSIKK